MRASIDLNSDMGESFSVYKYGSDEEIIPIISSANIACGFHAGDPSVIRKTVRMAKQFGVRVGAHIGFPDRLGFGRRYMTCSTDEVHDYVLYQLGAIYGFSKAENISLSHVKLHGALYMMALEDANMAASIVEAVRSFQPDLLVYTIAGSALAEAASATGLQVISEYFADRPYTKQGVKMFGWTPEEIGSPDAIADRVKSLVLHGQIEGAKGEMIQVSADSVCVHSDTPWSGQIVRAIQKKLQEANCDIASPVR